MGEDEKKNYKTNISFHDNNQAVRVKEQTTKSCVFARKSTTANRVNVLLYHVSFFLLL